MLPDFFKYFASVIVGFSFVSCGSPKHSADKTSINYFKDLKKDTAVRYAHRFALSENNYCKVIYVFGHTSPKDTSAIFVILKDSTLKSLPNSKITLFKSPCKRIASLSSIYTSMLCALGEQQHIVAIENIDYYNNADILRKFQKGELEELVRSPKIDVEKTIVLNPDIIFTFGMGNPEKDINAKIAQADIPMVITVDHLEETPLARAEWLKFFGAFTGKEKQADSIFKAVEKNYYELKQIAAGSKNKPTVFSEIKFGEIWYVPGGKSFAATLFKDANANYIWRNDNQSGSLHLSFEEVYNKAHEADYWLNMALVRSKKELFGQENRYAEFKAYKSGKLFNNIKTVNTKGYSDYWETGILYPNRVLSDLIQIFHPELKPVIKNDLYYYRKLNESE
ncbi:MAG: ABC transporter substrate-binding protein [Bacteroidetes bacterium]|nr:ABC transporter substrate-binding protein [Bacteroidota bacterium]